MSDPFRQFFLDTVEKAISRDPDEQSLLSLLQIVSPSLTLEYMLSSRSDERRKIFKSLILRIHPDKHPKDDRVTLLFQNVQNFYDECNDRISSSSLTRLPESPLTGNGNSNNNSNDNSAKKRKRRSKQIHYFPQEFSVYSKWPHTNVFQKSKGSGSGGSTVTANGADNGNSNTGVEMDSNRSSSSTTTTTNIHYPYPPNKNKISPQTLPPFQAYKCIHSRASITHGKKITKFLPWKNVEEHGRTNHNVKQVFDSEFGGTKELDNVDDIKEELMMNGPVVSVKFQLMDAYVDRLKGEKGAFVENLQLTKNEDKGTGNGSKSSGVTHELLIVGWSLTPYGEAWKVQFLFDSSSDDEKEDIGNSVRVPLLESEPGPRVVHIGFGQFQIDDLCYAPKSNLENLSWQEGPYFDADFTDAPQWREWKEMDLPSTESELVLLGKCFKRGIFSGETFVVRDRDKLAHSSSYVVKNLRWDESTKEWIITVLLAE